MTDTGSTTSVEEELIAILLNEPEQFFDIAATTRPEHFRDKRLGTYFRAISDVHHSGSEFTFALVEERLPRSGDGTMDEMRLPTLAAMAPFGVMAEERAEILRKRYKRLRAKEYVMPAIARIVANEELDGDEIPLQIATTVEDAYADETPQTTRSAREMRSRAARKRMAAQDPTGAFMSGVDAFDRLVGPFLPGQVTVVAGATSSGKSALAQQIAWNAASHGIPTLLQTNEMSSEEAWDRFVCQMARVSTERFLSGTLNADEDERCAKAEYELEQLPLFLDDTEKPKVAKIRLTAQGLKRKHGLRLAIIDHLQFLQPRKRQDKEYNALTELTSDVKAMAKKTGVHIILVSHLSREGTKFEVRTAKDIMRPRMSDLHGSSTIEKDADNIVMVHRPAYFLERNPQTPGSKDYEQWEVDRLKWSGRAELIKHKKRGGKGWGIETVGFVEECTLFRDLDDGYEGTNAYQDDLIDFGDSRLA